MTLKFGRVGILLATLLLVACVSGSVAPTPPETAPTPVSASPTPSASSPAHLLSLDGRVHVPAGVDAEVGYGALWVSGGNRLTKIDIGSGRIDWVIPLKGAEDDSRIAFGDHSVWVSADRGIVYRIRRGRVAQRIKVPLPNIEAVAFAVGFLWVGSAGGPGELLRVSPSGKVIGFGSPITIGETRYAIFAYGYLWISTGEGIDRVDPATGAVAYVSGTPDPGRLAAGAGSIWSTSSTETDQVLRIGPSSAEVTSTIPVGLASAAAYSGGMLWVMTEPPSKSKTIFLPSRKHPGTVILIDPRTNQVVGERLKVLGLQPISIAGSGDTAWVVDYYDGLVTRIKTG